MNWLDIVSKIMEQDEDKIQLAPLSNIAGADIKFDKGYGTLKINVPSDVADDLTNSSHKYMGGLLLIDRQTYKDVEKKIDETPDKNGIRHGKWIKAPCSEKDGDAHCSECNHWDWSDCKYCSECGAKMDA